MKKRLTKDKRDRHFAMKHALKMAERGEVVLTQNLLENASRVSPVTPTENDEVDKALARAWSNFS